jgi:parallel beta-helix repeat protein
MTGAGLQNTSDVIISNNLFYHNRSYGGGGAIAFSNCSGFIANNTIVNNKADNANGGGILCYYGSSPSFYNNIIFGNYSDTTLENIFVGDNSSDPDFYNNVLQGGYSAINTNGTPLTGANVQNLNITPGFTNAAANDYTLAFGSPCIDAGDTTGISRKIPAFDLAGNVRITNAGIDIGAYETADTTTAPPLTIIGQGSRTSIYVVPNPVTNYFEIIGIQPSDIGSVQVFDMLGRQVAYFKNAAYNHFDISNLPAGALLVSVTCKDASVRVARMIRN